MYQVIARKYRPQSFADLVNQEHIKRTLSNAIEQRRIAHGYIFSGQRGTGKTTVARIMARCLNCVDGPTMSPCGKCSSCLEVSAGNSVDVIEIDAASNRGINEMRELRESVRFRPARDRYKVFIIDEAHQITNDAFNALLKTLEEPPEWVVFMLCTTEAHKLPATISSRCQHFSFRSVEMDELIARMEWICGQEGIEASPEALAVIAQSGGGSVRDSLSSLDQAIACCGNTLNAEQVRLLMGAYSLDTLSRVTDALTSENGLAMLEVVDELERSGQNLQHFCRELSGYFRNLLVVKVSGASTRLVAASRPEVERLAAIAEPFSERDLTRYLNIILEVFGQLQHSLQPRFHMELGLIRLINAGRLANVEQAIAELRKGGDGLLPEPPRSSGPGGAGTGSVTTAAPGGGGSGAASRFGEASGATGAPGVSPRATSAGTSSSGRAPVLSGGTPARGGAMGFRSLSAGLAAAPAVAPDLMGTVRQPESRNPADESSEPAQTNPLASAAATGASAAVGPRLGLHQGGKAKPAAVGEDASEAGSGGYDATSPRASAAPPAQPELTREDVAKSQEGATAAPELHGALVEALNEIGKRFTADGVERARVSVQTLPAGALELQIFAPRDASLSVKEPDIRAALGQALIQNLGLDIQRVKLQFGDVEPVAGASRKRKAQDDDALRAEVEADPDIEYIRDLFHGTITRVRSLRA